MKNEHSGPKKPFDPADFPALREFLPAYLHQDFAEEYGSAEKAVKGFLAEASGDEILQVKEEWRLIRAAFRGRPFGEFQTAMVQLGSTWLPEKEEQLEEWDEILSRAEA